MGISDLRNPVDSIKIKSEPSEPKTTLISWVLSVHSIQSAIPNPKSEIERIPDPKSRESEIERPEAFNPAIHLYNRLNYFILSFAVRKILTTKSEIIQLTSYLLPNKLSCYLKLDGPFSSGPNLTSAAILQDNSGTYRNLLCHTSYFS